MWYWRKEKEEIYVRIGLCIYVGQMSLTPNPCPRDALSQVYNY